MLLTNRARPAAIVLQPLRSNPPPAITCGEMRGQLFLAMRPMRTRLEHFVGLSEKHLEQFGQSEKRLSTCLFFCD